MMMIVVREERPGDWQAWIGLGDDGDPSREGVGFVIGRGPTRDEALAAAVADLEAVVEQLQSEPPARSELPRPNHRSEHSRDCRLNSWLTDGPCTCRAPETTP